MSSGGAHITTKRNATASNPQEKAAIQAGREGAVQEGEAMRASLQDSS